MKIKKINLKEYKRFKNLTIDLGENPKRIIALVGPNGCGKSSVFDGLLYKIDYTIGQIGNTSSRGSDYHSLNKDPNYDSSNITLIFDEGNLEQLIHNKDIQFMKKIISFRSPFRFNSNLNIREQKSMSKLSSNDYGASTTSDLDQRIETNYRRLKIKYDDYLNENNCRPSDAKDHILGDLNEAIQNCLKLEISDLGNIDKEGEGTLFFKKSDNLNKFNFNVLSSGEKEIIDILIDLYIRKDEYTESIYIIDEPELHLNTSIQRNLLLQINKMIPDKCQIWVATHSIGFLRTLQNELKEESQVIEFSKDNNWASETYNLKPIDRNPSDWRRLFSTALDDLSNLICPKTLIYCEGKDITNEKKEELGLDANIYNKIFAKQHPEALFVSSGGNTLVEHRGDLAFMVLSKVIKELHIYLLKDMDSNSGKPVDLSFREKYLQTNPNHHRMLNRYEIENFLFDKEILELFCKKYNTTFDNNAYNLIVKDISLDDVKSKILDIKHLCNVSNNISENDFKLKLAELITPETNVYKELHKVIFDV